MKELPTLILCVVIVSAPAVLALIFGREKQNGFNSNKLYYLFSGIDDNYILAFKKLKENQAGSR